MRHHDLRTGELRDAHRQAWETYLRRLAIRVAGGVTLALTHTGDHTVSWSEQVLSQVAGVGRIPARASTAG